MTTTKGEAPSFSLDDVEGAAGDFERATADLRRADSATWSSRLDEVVHVCRENAVVRHVLRPLRDVPVDAEAWHQNRRMGINWARHAGGGPLETPPGPGGAAALMLALLEWYADARVDVVEALYGVVGMRSPGTTDVRTGTMADVLLTPLQAYVERRLEALRRTVRPPAPPPVTYSNTYNAPVALATHGEARFDASPVTVTQTTTYASTSDLGQEIMAWTQLLAGVEADRHAEVREAIQALAKAADQGGGRPLALAAAAETVVTAAPPLRERAAAVVTAWSGKLAGAVATGMATETGKQLMEHHEKVLAAISTALRHS